jgi:arylsulfatase
MIERNADMSTLTSRYTDEAIASSRKTRRALLRLSRPLDAAHEARRIDRFRGKSKPACIGDVVEELDFHVGRLLDTLKAEGLDDSTYVIFTSDNGPWFLDRHLVAPSDPATKDNRAGSPIPFTQRDERGAHGGSAGPLRGYKTSQWEGGFRVPGIVRAPRPRSRGEGLRRTRHHPRSAPHVRETRRCKGADRSRDRRTRHHSRCCTARRARSRHEDLLLITSATG